MIWGLKCLKNRNFLQKLDKNHEILIKKHQKFVPKVQKLDLKTQKLDFSAFLPSAPQWNCAQKKAWKLRRNRTMHTYIR